MITIIFKIKQEIVVWGSSTLSTLSSKDIIPSMKLQKTRVEITREYRE